MKPQTHLIALIIAGILLASCATPESSDAQAIDHENLMKEMEDGEHKHLFEAMRDRVNELERDEGLRGLMKSYGDGESGNAFDDLLAEIEVADRESNGQLGQVIEGLIGHAEEELGFDLTSAMTGALDSANSFFTHLEEGGKAVSKQLDDSGIDVENLIAGLEDFIATSGKNGGMERIMEEIVSYEKSINPDAENSEWVIKMEEIINNDEKDFEVETRRILEEALDKLQRDAVARGHSL